MDEQQHHEEINHLIAQGLPVTETIEKMVAIYKALGNPTRLRIILALNQATLSVNEIAAILDMTQSSISHQLSILKQLHLVQNVRRGQHIHYQLADAHIMSIVAEAKEHVTEVLE